MTDPDPLEQVNKAAKDYTRYVFKNFVSFEHLKDIAEYREAGQKLVFVENFWNAGRRKVDIVKFVNKKQIWGSVQQLVNEEAYEAMVDSVSENCQDISKEDLLRKFMASYIWTVDIDELVKDIELGVVERGMTTRGMKRKMNQ
jgi:hypothetical protein